MSIESGVDRGGQEKESHFIERIEKIAGLLDEIRKDCNEACMGEQISSDEINNYYQEKKRKSELVAREIKDFLDKFIIASSDPIIIFSVREGRKSSLIRALHEKGYADSEILECFMA